MPILITIVIWMITAIVSIIGAFLIKRYFLYARYIRSSNIPFLKIKSYFSGSIHSIITSHKSIAEMLDEYFELMGDTYSFFVGPVPYIFTKDIDLIHHVWVKQYHKHINRNYLGAKLEDEDCSLLQARDDDWRRTRRAIGSAMTPAKLKAANVDRDITECVNNLMLSLEKRCKIIIEDNQKSVTIDCCNLFKTFTMDTFLRAGFDQANVIDYNLDDNQLVTTAKDLMKKAHNPIVMWTFYIHELSPIVRYLIRISKIGQFVQYLFDIVDKIIAKMLHVKMDNSDKKMIHSLLTLYEDGKITKIELRHNVFFLLMAGWDTTADTLTGLMWELARNPAIQDKLRDELVKNGKESKYLEWVIKETLRLHPPAITGREIGEDFQWKGYNIMKGMVICLASYSVQRDTKIWGQDALEYRPERFGEAAGSGDFHPAQFLAFGLGPRNCVGYHFAMYELKELTSRLILDYRIVFTNNTPVNLKLKEGTGTLFFVNIIQDPVPLKFVPLTQAC